MSDIFVIHRGVELGPFTVGEVRVLLGRGELSQDDMARGGGSNLPRPLSSLFPPAFSREPPPLPSSAGPLPIWAKLLIGGAILCALGLFVGVPILIAIGVKAAEARWQTTSINGLSLETPFVLKPIVMEGGDEGSKSVDFREGDNISIYVMASVVGFFPEIQVDLDEEAELLAGEFLGTMAKEQKTTVPDFQITRTTVEGQPARSFDVTLTSKFLGSPQATRIRGLLIQSGARMGQVVVVQILPGPGAEKNSDRVLRSVSLSAPAPGSQ